MGKWKLKIKKRVVEFPSKFFCYLLNFYLLNNNTLKINNPKNIALKTRKNVNLQTKQIDREQVRMEMISKQQRRRKSKQNWNLYLPLKFSMRNSCSLFRTMITTLKNVVVKLLIASIDASGYHFQTELQFDLDQQSPDYT